VKKPEEKSEEKPSTEKPVEKQPVVEKPVVEVEPIYEQVEQPIVKDEYAEKITLLQSMGFDDANVTRTLLKKHGGNVQRVVGELLK